MVKIAVLVGGKTMGSNMEALALACQDGSVPARIALVVAPSIECPAAEGARKLGLPVEALPSKEDGYGEKLLGLLEAAGADYVCLCGYLSLLPQLVLGRFSCRVINIHPALLPKFGGKGMYGLNVHRAVLEAGETVTGCTVHFVTEHYDEGEIILQLTSPVWPDDTPESLAARVLSLEHRAYPEALRNLILANGD